MNTTGVGGNQGKNRGNLWCERIRDSQPLAGPRVGLGKNFLGFRTFFDFQDSPLLPGLPRMPLKKYRGDEVKGTETRDERRCREKWTGFARLTR
jgi:hypothetical protein